MVIPAELLQVNYAARLRQFLSEQFSEITLLTFKTLLFEGIQQEVVLLLGERNGKAHSGVRTIELEDINDVLSYQHTEFAPEQLKPMSHSTEKWTQYFLDVDEILLLRELRYDARLTMAGQVMEVDVGIVTGLNEFFVLLDSQAQQNGLTDYVHPLVGRSGQLRGLSFTECDWQYQVDQNLPAYLLQAPDVDFDQLPLAVKAYVAEGEKRNYHGGYKCRIRKRWYIVPSVWTPDAFMLRQVHAFPKIVLNQARVTCTDTIHRVRFKPGVDASVVTLAFTNSLTFAFAEVIGRSYGGGVLELEPNEAESLPLPLLGGEQLDLEQLDGLVRAGEIDKVLDITDEVLLRRGLGLGSYETEMLRHIWQKLRDRRIQRKYKRSPNGGPLPAYIETVADG